MQVQKHPSHSAYETIMAKSIRIPSSESDGVMIFLKFSSKWKIG